MNNEKLLNIITKKYGYLINDYGFKLNKSSVDVWGVECIYQKGDLIISVFIQYKEFPRTPVLVMVSFDKDYVSSIFNGRRTDLVKLLKLKENGFDERSILTEENCKDEGGIEHILVFYADKLKQHIEYLMSIDICNEEEINCITKE